MIKRYTVEADDSLKGFDEAIEKLVREWGAEKIEGSEDCVKRDDAQDIMARLLSDYLHDEDREKIENANAEIGELPSVQPQPKREKWIDTGMWLEGRKYGKEHGEMIDAYSCEYCGYSQYHKTNFCPNCGCYCGGDDNVDE